MPQAEMEADRQLATPEAALSEDMAWREQAGAGIGWSAEIRVGSRRRATR
jgi:hypothetical protein